MLKNSVRFSHLMKCPLLADLTEDQKFRFIDECAVEYHEEPQIIFHQGEKPHGMILVAHGGIEVSFESDDGNRAIIHHTRVGETLGEAEALADRPCVATCTSQANTTFLFCPTPLLYEHIRSPVFVRNIAKLFCDRLQHDNEVKSIDQFLPVDQRIYRHLANLAQKKPIITQSQAYLADLVGCSRQTVNKALGTLRDAGIVELRKGEIEVLDRAALEAELPDVQARIN